MLEDGWLRFLRMLGFPATVKSLTPDTQPAHRTRRRKDGARAGNWPAVASWLLVPIAVVAFFAPMAYWPVPSLLLLLLAAVFGVVGRRRGKTGAPYRGLATAGLALALLTVALLVLGFLVLLYAVTHGGPPVN